MFDSIMVVPRCIVTNSTINRRDLDDQLYHYQTVRWESELAERRTRSPATRVPVTGSTRGTRMAFNRASAGIFTSRFIEDLQRRAPAVCPNYGHRMVGTEKEKEPHPNQPESDRDNPFLSGIEWRSGLPQGKYTGIWSD